MSRIALAYDKALRCATPRTHEQPSPANEMAWQAAWFSGAFGRDFETREGIKIRIVNFGEWSREAGPDFVRATVRIGDHMFHGAIELDLLAGGWEQHGHALNPDYENVVLHIVAHPSVKRNFPRTASNREVAQIFLGDRKLSPIGQATPLPAHLGRCSAPLRALSPAALDGLISEAAMRRFARKALLLRTMADARGADNALYESLAVALGYKNNKLPFQVLAQHVPRKAAATPRGEALLFGIAGFLDQPEPPSAAARREISALWQNWWRMRSHYTTLPRRAWKLSGLRPANHPLRRLGALATAARNWKSVRPALESADFPLLKRTLGGLQHPFWSYCTGWNSNARPDPLALIGAERIRDIFINICLPWSWPDIAESLWRNLPAGPSSTPLRVAQARLFGTNAPRVLPRKLYAQQGLLQIYADFCLHEKGDCSHCPFPDLAERLSS